MNLDEMFALARARLDEGPESGTTGRLLADGVDAIGKKLVEEAAESWMAGRFETDDELAVELSQVLYYVTCMAVRRGLSADDLYAHL
jgi:phosphoribosyl-ATP pyrophosphohydrolase